MSGNLSNFRKRLLDFYGRHPLFVTALVAVVSVILGRWHFGLGLGCGLFLGGFGWRWFSWRTGIAWVLCSWLAMGVFLFRSAGRNVDERQLLGSIGGLTKGRILKDAKGGVYFWTAPAMLLTGPHAGAKVLWQGRGELPIAGSWVAANGSFGPLEIRRNPGEFDRAAWLTGQGVAAIFHGEKVIGKIETGWWEKMKWEIRQNFRSAVTAGVEEDSQEALVIRAVVIGESPQDADELVAAFRNSGTLHAFSVSGLHVAMVGSIGWMVLSLLGVPRRWAVLVLLPLIFGYAWITGNSLPALRSAWMAAVFLGAFIFRRRPDLLNALGAVLLVAMLWDGRLLFQPGVQLSYGVVAAIAIGTSWASRWFSGISKPELYLPKSMMNFPQKAWLSLREKVAQSLTTSVAASIGSTPLTVFHFGLITPISVLAGVILVPLIFLLLSVSLLTAAIYQVSPPVASWIHGGNRFVARCCVKTAEGFAKIPGGHFQFAAENEPFLLIYDLDHGAGAACFSGGKGNAVLFDCGDRYSFKRQVAPSLRRLGISPDSVILSHPDGGHLGSGAAVWTTFPIHQALLPVSRSRSPGFQSWLEDAPAAGIQILQAGEISELPMPDGARLEILHAPDSLLKNAIADERVAIYRLHWRGWKFLFVSDAGVNTESAMLATNKDLSADVIIAGHHRSDTSLSDSFLDAVDPQMIVASHAELPTTEKLHPDVVSYWRSRGIQVIHQGKSGGVTIKMSPAGDLLLGGFVDRSLSALTKRTKS
ncbi:MAG: hypothetical protein HC845_03655 [Akkermansiaceae bacterium]|nr:hypothetical protein [Akkermansiaceae bacterium]